LTTSKRTRSRRRIRIKVKNHPIRTLEEKQGTLMSSIVSGLAVENPEDRKNIEAILNQA
jgi:hypothetical protein